MCDYEKVVYGCGHFRLLVRAWCTVYVSSQGTIRCGVNVVGNGQNRDPCSSMSCT